MKDINDLVTDLQNKTNFSIDRLSGLGAIDAALKESQLSAFAVPKYEGLGSWAYKFKELNLLGNNFLRSFQYDNSFQGIAASLAAQKNDLLKLNGSFNMNDSISQLMNSASKSVFNIPPDYGSSLANIINNQNSMFNRLDAHKSILSSFGAMQADLLAKNSWRNTDSFLASTIAAKDWEDLQIFEEETEEINEIADKALDGTTVDPGAFHSLQNKFDDLLREIQSEKSKKKRQKLVAILNYTMAIISFLLALWAAYQQVTDLTNAETVALISSEVKNSEKRIINSINTISHQRLAIANVNLRVKPNKRSQKISLIKMGEKVSVISINHKWLYVMYVDSETGKPVTGWVYKKYFEKM